MRPKHGDGLRVRGSGQRQGEEERCPERAAGVELKEPAAYKLLEDGAHRQRRYKGRRPTATRRGASRTREAAGLKWWYKSVVVKGPEASA